MGLENFLGIRGTCEIFWEEGLIVKLIFECEEAVCGLGGVCSKIEFWLLFVRMVIGGLGGLIGIDESVLLLFK